MMIIKRVDPLAAAKIEGLIGVIFGFLVGLFIGIISSVFGALLKQAAALEGGTDSIGSMGFFALGWLAVIVMPIMYGIMLFLAGLIGAWIYNLVAKMVGGMKLDIEMENVEVVKVQKPVQQQPVQQPVQKLKPKSK